MSIREALERFSDESLVMSAGITTAPDDGKRIALLMLTCPGRGAVLMPRIARALGFDARPGAHTRQPRRETWAEMVEREWVVVHSVGPRLTAVINADWAEAAESGGRLLLAVGYFPLPLGGDRRAYGARLARTKDGVTGLLPLTCSPPDEHVW